MAETQREASALATTPRHGPRQSKAPLSANSLSLA